MINSRNLRILKKYKDSRHVYCSETIFKRFITKLYYGFNKNNIDENDYKRLFLPIFIHNFIRYLYNR